MARALPSQVRAFIATAFPWVEDLKKRRTTTLGAHTSPRVAAIVDLFEQMPQERFVLDGAEKERHRP